MYTLVRQAGVRAFLLREATTGIASLAIADTFYKFHSFLLETGAFLATWFVLSWAAHSIGQLFKKKE